MDRKKALSGFSLVELMIVLTIIGVLSAVSFPVYQNYVQETRRADAWTALNAAAAAQQRWYAVHFKYTANIDQLGGGTSPEGLYQISVNISDGGYTLTANADKSGVQSSDTDCTSMTLNHLGVQSPAQCW